jgi:hypothetical protein
MSNVFLEHAAASLATAPSLIPKHVVEAIRGALPPSVLISKYVHLKRAGREWKGLSPFNKERTPSFTVNDQKGFYHDFSSGKHGDIFTFAMELEGLSFPEAVRRCADMAGIVIPTPSGPPAPMAAEEAEAAADRERRRQEELGQQAEADRRRTNFAKSIARDSHMFQMGDGSPPALFLAGRGLHMPDDLSPRVLLFHPHCPFPREGSDVEVHHPALVAIHRDIITDKVMAISRRPLTPDGRSLGKPVTLGPGRGSAVKLTPCEDVCQGLHLAEGVTTGLAAMALGMVPVWCTGGSGGLAPFPILPGVDHLTIICDHDLNGSGQRAANECLARWQAAGREASIVMPPTPGTDLADYVQERQRRR